MRLELQPRDGWLNPKPEGDAPTRIVHVWALSCGLCKAQMPSVRRWLARPDVEVISVHTPIAPSDASPADVARVAAAHGLTAPIALDHDGRIADDLEVSSLPAYFVVDATGLRLAAAGAGADRRVDAFLATSSEATAA